MSRKEDFIQAGIDYRIKHGKPMCIAGSDLADVERDFNRVISFEAGAEYGYKYAIDKACEWLESLSGYVVSGEKANVKYFRRAMEE